MSAKLFYDFFKNFRICVYVFKIYILQGKAGCREGIIMTGEAILISDLSHVIR